MCVPSGGGGSRDADGIGGGGLGGESGSMCCTGANRVSQSGTKENRERLSVKQEVF